MKILKTLMSIAIGASAVSLADRADAAQFSLTIDGADAIFLAGRTDLVIPPAGQVWNNGLARHPITPEMIQEQFPESLAISGGQIVRVLDPAQGGVSFFNGFGGTTFGPEGNGVPGSSSLGSFGGISGYLGTQGALVGVFLNNNVPVSGAPATLDFRTSALGVNFDTLSPGLGQVFFIGDGKNAANLFQEFVAPTGATRVFFGVVDGFNFNGPAGAYDDNDGAYRIRVAIDEIPVVGETPIPGALPLFASGLGALGLFGWRRRKKASA